jgi:flagellin-like protein
MPRTGRRTEKMKKIYEKEEGVSPVIATILMVAITVVLAATVYIMVAGMGGGGTNKMIASLTYDQQSSNPSSKVVLRVAMSNPSSADFTKVTVVLTPPTGAGGSAKLGSDGTASIKVGSTTYNVAVQDLDGSNSLSDGDNIVITGGNLAGYTISISISGYSGNAQVTVPSS